MVLKEFRALIRDPRGKFRQNWIGPFKIKTILSRGAVKLTNLDVEEYDQYTNLDKLKSMMPK